VTVLPEYHSSRGLMGIEIDRDEPLMQKCTAQRISFENDLSPGFGVPLIQWWN
jgi:hypothetical protein